MANSSGAHDHSESSVDGSPEKAPNFTPRSQALAVDQRWQASQGIMFSTLAQNNQAWPPSLGINFSLSNPVPRQPYSTSSGSTPAATSPIKATQTSSPMTSHSRDRYIPSPRPYQPSKSPKALGSDLFSSGPAAEEDLVMDDDEDIGELLERASREKLQPTNKIPILAPESMDTTTGPAKIDHDAVSPEPLTVTPIKPFTRIAPSETKALKASKAASSSTRSLPTDVPQRNSRPVQLLNLRVDAVNVLGTRNPQDAPPRNHPGSLSPASLSQRPSESEIERLAQLSHRPVTARNNMEGLVSANDTGHCVKPTNLELMYVHGERIQQSHYSIMKHLQGLHEIYQSHPTYHPKLHNPIEIQDLLDEFEESRWELEHGIHQLRFIMWKVQELRQTLSEQGTLEGSKIARRLTLFCALDPFHEFKVGQIRLWRAFRMYDRFCRRRGRKFLAKPLDGIKGQRGSPRGKRCTLYGLLYYCAGPWQEADDYVEIRRRALEPDMWLHHARNFSSSWRRIINAVKGAQNFMRESPRGLVRSELLSRAFDPICDDYRGIASALRDIEKCRPANSTLGSSTATPIPDLHDKPDFLSDPLSMASASASVAAEGEEDLRTRSTMANFPALGNPERQIHKSSEKAAGNAAEMERARDGPMQRASNWRPASDGNASKAVLRQSTNNAARRRPIKRSGNLMPLSRSGQHEIDFREHDLSGFVHRDRVSYSANRVLLAITKLLEFVKEQGDHGRQTLTNFLDLQDMKEEWHISEDRLTAAMHNYRAVARIRREFAHLLLQKQSPQMSNTISVTQYFRLKKLQFFKAAWGQSKKDLLIACNHLKDFQRRRGLVQLDERRKDTPRTFNPKHSLRVLGSVLPELSDFVSRQYSKTWIYERDLLVIGVRTSLTRLLMAIKIWRNTLPAAKVRKWKAKNIMTTEHVRCLQQALELLPSIQSKATLSRRVFPTTLGAAEASADVEAIPVPLPDLNHKPPVMVETSKAETRKSSGILDRRSKRPSKSRKLKYVKGFQIRRINSDRTLSQGTISALGSEKAVQKKSLSDARIAKRGSLKSSLIQKRAIHCSPSYGPSVEVESELPSTLLGSSKFTSCGPLGYRITDTILEGASRPDQDAKPLHWEYTLYRSPLGEKVKVHYCKTKADTERIARLFFDEEVLGFDIEWKPNATAKEGIKKNVALIQIASEERIALFHIARFRGEDTVDDLVTPTFKYIMQTPRITKVGVSIKADCTRLRRYMGIESRGLFELSHLYKLVKYSPSNASSVDKRLVRLAAQVEEHLGLPLWKGQDVRGSDWSSADLNYQQVQYAASDCYAGFQLYHTLEHKRLALDPTPPRPYHAELNLPIRLSSGLSIPTDDEQTDLEDDPPTVDDPANPPSVEELAHDFLTMKIKAPLPPLHKPSKTPHKPPPKPPTPEYTTAQSWATTYRAALPFPHKPTASPASLRAYALWHEQGHTVPEAAALLRDPPLQNATVAVYVLEALRLEKLPFERGRLEVLLGYVPMGGRGRYRGFLGGCGIGVE